MEYKRHGGKTVDLTLMQALMQEAVDRLLNAKLSQVRKAMRELEKVI